ncbi:MAG: hypothetical protein JWM90_1618 [Thermoleophilia bacterium]|nr:hypothetical protein [Thermoleophilia bacterium]
MKGTDPQDIVRQAFEAVSSDDMKSYKQLLAEKFVMHDNDDEPVRGKENAADYFRQYRKAFPDMQVKIDGDVIASGDTCATRWTVTGTHEGELLGVAPTHKKVVVHGMEIDRIRDGKIAESWQSWDHFSLFQQLGEMPSEQRVLARH